MQHEHYDVIIIGAGLAGCATAAALAAADPERRRKVLVVDRYKEVHPRFSGEFIHPRGTQVLEDLGFYAPLVEAGAIDVDGFVVFENADGTRVDLPYASVPEERPRGLAVHHKVLVRTLRRVLRERGEVELVEGWSLEELQWQGDRVCGVVLQDRKRNVATLTCDLLVGADGKSSAVRKLANIPEDGRETIGFTAGLEIRNASLPHPRAAHVFLGAWGPVLAYPIHREPDGTIVTRMTFDLPRELPAKGSKLKEHVLRSYVPFLPSPLAEEAAAAMASLPGALEMAPTVNLPAPHAIMPGIVLVGDAGGCSHPITASGMTMGLRDAETLGIEARKRARVPAPEPWIDFASLRRYRAEHDRYVPTRQALADAIYEAFRGEREGSRAIRRALFQYWNSGELARSRSMALLSCSERRPTVFLKEYLKTARWAFASSILPRHARKFPVEDRVRQARGAASLARDKLGLVAAVMWAQVRPSWLPRSDERPRH